MPKATRKNLYLDKPSMHEEYPVPVTDQIADWMEDMGLIEERLLRSYVRSILLEGSRIVPTGMSMKEWEKYKKKNKISAKKYDKEKKTKWKITHGPGHKDAGKTIKGNTGLTYKKAKSIQNAFGGW